jgi:hypothetical protein
VTARQVVLTAGVRWCPACVLRARERGTVRELDDMHAGKRLVLVVGERVAGDLVCVMDAGPCHACGDVVSPRWAVQPAPKVRGLGRSPRESPQGSLTLGRRNG